MVNAQKEATFPKVPVSERCRSWQRAPPAPPEVPPPDLHPVVAAPESRTRNQNIRVSRGALLLGVRKGVAALVFLLRGIALIGEVEAFKAPSQK